MKRFKNYINVLFMLLLLILDRIMDYFINADTSDAEGFFQKCIKPILNYQLPVITIVTIFIIIMAINEALKVSLKEEISSLKEEIKEYREITKDKSLDLLINLKDMQRIHKQDKLREFIKNYTKSNPYVVAVQIYQFNYKHTILNTVYKVNYVDGYVRDDEEVNAISQIFYRVSRTVTKQFYNAYKEYIDNNYTKLNKFVTSQLKKLNSKKIEDISDEDCIVYSLVIYSIQLLSENGEEIISTIYDPNKEELLNNKKRTGILRGIIHNDFYKFNYTGNDDIKKDRLYVTFCKEINYVDYLFLITFSPEINTNNQDEEMFISDSVNQFQERSNEFDNMI